MILRSINTGATSTLRKLRPRLRAEGGDVLRRKIVIGSEVWKLPENMWLSVSLLERV